MKSYVLILLSTLLAMAILAPSIITLSNLEEKTITLDFNEEEKNEEQNEAKEKDFFLDIEFNSLAHLEGEEITISQFYIEGAYKTSLSILLPPPERFFS